MSQHVPRVCAILMGGVLDEETTDAYRRMVFERSTGAAFPTAPAPPRQRSAREEETNRKAAIGRLRLAIIQKCTHRGEKIGQGCQCQYRCAKGHGSFERGVVSHQDCHDCVQGRPPKPIGG